MAEELADIKDIVRAAYDGQAGRYGAHTRLQSGNLDHLLARLSAAAGGRPRGRWLDVGCGTGLLARRLREGGFSAPERDAREYVGIDLSTGRLDLVREVTDKEAKRRRRKHGDAAELLDLDHSR